MNRRPKKSLSQAITEFLETKGASGATLQEIYAGVRARLGPSTSDVSIRARVYQRLIDAKKSAYRRTFERISVRGVIRYRLLTGYCRWPS